MDNRFGAIVFYKYAKREMVMGLIKKRKWILFLLFVFCLTALPALAQEPFRLGWLQVEPGVGYQGEYNDNIYREKSNTVDDYINTLSFGCNVRLQSTHMDNFKLGIPW